MKYKVCMDVFLLISVNGKYIPIMNIKTNIVVNNVISSAWHLSYMCRLMIGALTLKRMDKKHIWNYDMGQFYRSHW